MTFPEQTAIIAFTARSGLLWSEDVQRWAFSVIEASAKPPWWVIELAAAPAKPLEDITPMLGERSDPPSKGVRLRILIASHSTGFLSLGETLPKLFQAVILDKSSPPRERDRQLVEALVLWDCQGDLNVLPAPLEARFHELFQGYIADASDVLSILSPLQSKGASPTAPANRPSVR